MGPSGVLKIIYLFIWVELHGFYTHTHTCYICKNSWSFTLIICALHSIRRLLKGLLHSSINSTNNFRNIPMESSVSFSLINQKHISSPTSDFFPGWLADLSVSHWISGRGGGAQREVEKGEKLPRYGAKEERRGEEMNQPPWVWCSAGCTPRRRQLPLLLQQFQHSFRFYFPSPLPLCYVTKRRQVAVINPSSHKITRDFFFFNLEANW